jgi:Leucine-rich repeat (LRR) protein
MATPICEKRGLCSLPSKLIVSCLTYAGNPQTCFVCKLFLAVLVKQENRCAFTVLNKIIFLRNLIPYVLSAALPFYLEASKFNIYKRENLVIRLHYLKKSEDKIMQWLHVRRPQLVAVRKAEFTHSMRLIPSELRYLNNLRELRISTGLVALNLNIGSLIHLTKLSLSNNALSDLPESFVYLQEITELRLDHNAFKEIPLVVCTLRKLRVFSLRHNQIKSFPAESRVWQDLTLIDFSHNQCTAMPESLSHCGSLRVIYAEYNRIRVCPKLKSYIAVKLIDLKGNPIDGTRNGVRIIKQKPKFPQLSTLQEQEYPTKPSRAVAGNSRYAKVVRSRSSE